MPTNDTELEEKTLDEILKAYSHVNWMELGEDKFQGHHNREEAKAEIQAWRDKEVSAARVEVHNEYKELAETAKGASIPADSIIIYAKLQLAITNDSKEENKS